MNLRNFTPHWITVGSVELAPEPEPARVAMVDREAGEIAGIPVITQEPGEVVGLPAPEEGSFFIVSGLVRAALPERADLLSPGRLIRNAAGRVTGCEALVASAPLACSRVAEGPATPTCREVIAEEAGRCPACRRWEALS